MNKKSIDNMIDSRLAALSLDKKKLHNSIIAKQTNQHSPHRLHMTIAAACLVLTLSLTALAAGLGYFDLFFANKAEIINDTAVEIDKSVENNGIVFTVKSAYTTEAGGYIAAKFEKKDGTEFGNEPHDGSPMFYYDYRAVPTFSSADGDQTFQFENPKVPYAQSVILSDDKKTLDVLLVVPRLADGQDIGGKNINVRFAYLQGPRRGAYYQGPWEMDVTMPNVDRNKSYDLNFSTTVSRYTPELPQKSVTIESVSLSPAGLFAVGTGDVSAMDYVLTNIAFELSDGEYVDYVIASTTTGVLDSKVVCCGVFVRPVNIDDIDAIYLNGTKIPLR